jgi:hypothetical protein
MSKRRKQQHRSPARPGKRTEWRPRDVLDVLDDITDTVRQAHEDPRAKMKVDPNDPDDQAATETAKHAIGVILRGLTNGDVYEVTSDMVGAVHRMAHFNRGIIPTLEEEDLPSQSGFVFLDDLWPEPIDGRIRFRALSWSRDTVMTSDHQRVPHVVVCLYGPHNKQIHVDLLPLGRDLGMEWSKRKYDSRNMRQIGHLIRALWKYLNSEWSSTKRVLVLDRPPQPHKRLSLHHGEVRVVVLRRATSDPDAEHGHRDVDWQCRWTVKEHWRHLGRYTGSRHHVTPDWDADDYVCATCLARGQRIRITVVGTYIKGPDGKPLLQDVPTIFKLAR